MDNTQTTNLTELAADIVSAYVSKNAVSVADLSTLITNVHGALQAIQNGDTTPAGEPEQKPAVPIQKSVTPDYIISLEDGQRYKSLKRHLSAKYGLTPHEYRAKWGLPKDYPMVAPNYAATRSALAKISGLGHKQDVSAVKNDRPAKRSKKSKAA